MHSMMEDSRDQILPFPSLADSGSTKFVSCLHMGNQEYIKFEGNFDNLDLTAHTYPTFLNLYQSRFGGDGERNAKESLV